jgi:hypothetical protein
MRQTRTTYRRLKSGWQQSVSLTAPVDPEVQQFLRKWSGSGKQVAEGVDALSQVQFNQGDGHGLVVQFQHTLGT